jgi:ABC-type glutathione transport system ATPase component
MTAPVVRLEAAAKTYVVGPPWRRRTLEALHPISLAVESGETLTIVGESGSGKTTLTRLCLGLLHPTAGHVFFEGRLLRPGNRRLRGRMAAVLQNPASSLNPRMTAAAAIEEPMRICGALDRKRIGSLLEQVGLPVSLAARLPHELSGGQQQRVAIARALSTSPRLVVFDEAVSALDVSVQAQVLNLIRDLRERVGFACLFVTHDIAVARYVGDRAIVMRAGSVVDEVRRADLYAGAKHPYTRALLVASGLNANSDQKLPA